MTAEQKAAAHRASSLKYYYSHKKKVQTRNDAWWKAHPEKLREKWRRKARKHKLAISVRKKAWRLKNLESVRKKNREWQQGQKNHRQEYMAKYYEANREKFIVRASNRVAIQKAASLEDTDLIKRWMKEIRRMGFVRCHWCGTKVPGRKVHFDHVTALANGGAHSISNLCASCSDCNHSKHARELCEWISRGQMFLSL